MLNFHLYLFFGEVPIKIFSLFINQVVFLLLRFFSLIFFIFFLLHCAMSLEKLGTGYKLHIFPGFKWEPNICKELSSLLCNLGLSIRNTINIDFIKTMALLFYHIIQSELKALFKMIYSNSSGSKYSLFTKSNSWSSCLCLTISKYGEHTASRSSLDYLL